MTTAIYGNSLYTVVDAVELSWNSARQEAIALGGDLVVIESDNENNFLFDYYRSALDADTGEINPTNIGGLYIGLSDEEEEGTWVWVNGVSLDDDAYTNWTIGNPSNSNNGEDYGELLIKDAPAEYNESKWNDTAGTYQGIAEIPLNLSITTSSTPKEGAGIFSTSINLSAGTEASGNLVEGAEVYWTVSGILLMIWHLEHSLDQVSSPMGNSPSITLLSMTLTLESLLISLFFPTQRRPNRLAKLNPSGFWRVRRTPLQVKWVYAERSNSRTEAKLLSAFTAVRTSM